MFNKTKQIYAIEEKNARQEQTILELTDKISALRNQNEYLIRTIRKMDDIVFAMGQCAGTNPTGFNGRFRELYDQAMARKTIESNRIGTLIETELHEVYTPQIENKS